MISLPVRHGGWLPDPIAANPIFNNYIPEADFSAQCAEGEQDFSDLGPFCALKEGALT